LLLILSSICLMLGKFYVLIADRSVPFFGCESYLLEESMKQWEDNLKILESVANSFDKDSVQYYAIEEAAQALIFLNMHEDLKKAYKQYRMQCGKELSEAEKQHLRDIGIEP
jgi:hypothetical protein